MALVSLLRCFPLTTHISTEHLLLLTPISSLQNPHRQSYHSINNLSFCQPPHSFDFLRLSLAHTPNLRIKTKESINFALKFASTSQERVLDSSPSNVSPEGQETEAASEEFSRTRLIAQNVHWTSASGDIRVLFERHGKVLEVELSMYNKTRNRGLAFVEMGFPQDLVYGKLSMYNKTRNRGLAFVLLKWVSQKTWFMEFEGRILNLDYARPKKKKTPPPMQPKPAVTYNLFFVCPMKRGLRISGNFLIQEDVVVLFLQRLYFMVILESLLVMDLCPSSPSKKLRQLFLSSKGRFLWEGQSG